MYADGFPCSRGQALTGRVAGPTHRYRWECLSERRETGRRETGDGRPETGDRRPETGDGGTGGGGTGGGGGGRGGGGEGGGEAGGVRPLSPPPRPPPPLPLLRSPVRLRSPVPRLPSLTHESSRSDARCLSRLRGHSSIQSRSFRFA